MGDLNFIGDVIYGLKMDFGQPIIIGRRITDTTDLITGEKTITETLSHIPNGIYLPINMRQQFLRQVGIHKASYLESGQREILVDKTEIPEGVVLERNISGGFVEINGNRGDIIKVEDYQHALIIVVTEITGMPS